jgi:type I restriction enzyme S subunit
MTKRDAKDEKKAPKLRFKGFTDDWEQHKLSDYLSIPQKEVISNAKDLKLMTLKLNLGGITLTANRETLKLGATIYYKRHEGQLLYGKQNFFHGSMALIPKEAEGYATSGDVPALNISRINKNYLIDYIGRPDYYKPKEALSTGTGSKRIHEKTLLSFDIQVPSLEEQTKINQSFQSLDHTITLHEEKQKQLEQLKKALLQKMFADKAGYPELRFTGFSRHWKQKKLKEVAEINPKTSIPKKFMYVDLESVSGTNLLSTKLIDKDVAPSRAQRTAQKGDIFYQTVRPYQKNNYLFELSDPLHPYVFSTGYAQIRTEQISNTFLFNILQQQSFVNKVLVRCTGTSYPAITGKELEKIKISTPLSLKEQEKIGQLFQHLDHTITLHAKKINQLKSLKQALLQQMFI